MFIKDSDIMFVNSILWGNDEFQAAFGYVDALSHVTLYASVIQDGGMGIYNEQLYGIFSGDPPITESPLFIIPLYPDEDDEPTIFGVFHLLSISPCIDAGNSDTPLDPDGTIADIGAYYFDQDGSVDDLPGFIFGDYNYGVNPIPNFENIMEALEFAVSEGLDTIIVTPGLYTGHIEITSAVTLTSFYSFDPYPGHVNSTILDRGIIDTPADSAKGSVIAVLPSNLNRDDETVISGFTIRNGLGWEVQDTLWNIDENGNSEYELMEVMVGGGIYVENTPVKITHNHFTDNGYFTPDSVSRVSSKRNTLEGGGMYIRDDDERSGSPTRNDTLVLRHNVFRNNYSEMGRSVMIKGWEGHVDMSYCDFDVYADLGDQGGLRVSNLWVNADSMTTFTFQNITGDTTATMGDIEITPSELADILPYVYSDSENPLTIHILPGVARPGRDGRPFFPLPLVNGLTLKGVRDQTVFDAEGTSGVMKINNVRNAFVEDLTIQNGGRHRGGGVYIRKSNPVFRNVAIKNNSARKGGGVFTCLLYTSDAADE